MSEFIQGMIVGCLLMGGIVALGWWVTQAQKPRSRQTDDPSPLTTRRRRMGP